MHSTAIDPYRFLGVFGACQGGMNWFEMLLHSRRMLKTKMYLFCGFNRIGTEIFFSILFNTAEKIVLINLRPFIGIKHGKSRGSPATLAINRCALKCDAWVIQCMVKVFSKVFFFLNATVHIRTKFVAISRGTYSTKIVRLCNL